MQQHCYKNYHLMVITKYFTFSESPLHQINNHLHKSLVRIKQTYRGQSYRQTAGGHTKKQTDRQRGDGGRTFVQTEKLPVLGVLHLSYSSHYRICNTKHVHIKSSGIRVTRPHMTGFPHEFLMERANHENHFFFL